MVYVMICYQLFLFYYDLAVAKINNLKVKPMAYLYYFSTYSHNYIKLP